MRASRLLSILMLLQTRGRMTAHALALEFEVSVRTIYRDIEQLSAADVPVYADRGPNGGFELLDGYRTKLTGLSPAEASTLFLAGLPGPVAELGLAGLLATAQLKVRTALPETARAAATRVAARFYLDPVGWFRAPDDARFLPTIASAVWDETCLQIRYRRYRDVVSRRVQPLGLVLKGGIWYLVSGIGEHVRSYRVANIVEVSATNEHFDRPVEFDLVRFWTTAVRAYELGLYRGNATLRVSPHGMTKWGLFASAVVEAATATASPPDAEGWVTVVIPIESVEDAAADILRLGIDAEVLGPPELRRLMGELARELAIRYREARNSAVGV